MALTTKQNEEIKKMLLEGCTLQEVADKVNVSLRTVKYRKKELEAENPQLTQIITENKYNRYTSKCEEVYLEKIKKEQHLFEDKEEGWVYQLTAAELKAKQSSKWFCGIAYPESVLEDWIDKLRFLGCELAISPLHDKDIWEHDSEPVVDEETGEIIQEAGARYKSGTKKKAHWHFIIKFDRVVSFKEANNIIRPITKGPYLQKCLSLKGQYEYFIHLNHPNKYPYEKDEIQKYNGFVIETTQSDRIIMVDEISQIIRKNKLIDMMELCEFYQEQYEYINVISLKGYFFEKLLQVNYRKAYPEGRVQKVRIVKE